MSAAASTGTKVLQVDSLKTYFFTKAGVVKAVDDVSFNVARGEVVGLVGEPGGGKAVTGPLDMGGGRPAGPHRRGELAPRRARSSHDERGKPAPTARQPRRDDLPGSDDDVESGAADRRPDDRGDPCPSTGCACGGARRGARGAGKGGHSVARRAARCLSAPVLRRHPAAR